MTIIGLENNYYLAQNNIWIKVSDFASATSFLELKVTNLTTGKEIPAFKLTPSPDNDFEFNICVPVAALFPEPDHLNVNSLQNFQFIFTANFIDGAIPYATETLSKYFVLGGRDQNENKEWFLENGEYLLVGKWIKYSDIPLPTSALFIKDSQLVEGIPATAQCVNMRCPADAKLLKFRNSLGGYQYFAFEKYQTKNRTRAGKTIPRITDRLRKDNFRNLPNESEHSIEFYTRTPFTLQEIFTDLVGSDEVYLYHPKGSDNAAKWELLKVEDNESLENNYDQLFENKISFSFSKYKNKR